jgi:cytochrome c-type biogenesis protein CcmH/NrfF
MTKRLLQVLAICLFSLTMLGADTSTTRLDRIGHKLVCQCGCTQILMECNHVGCPVSPVMIDELRTQLTAGAAEPAILKTFIAKYGPIVLAAPIRGGFDNVAWIVPIAAFVLCLAGVLLLLRHWKRRHAALAPAAPAPPSGPINDRIRRDTDYDNWSDGQ